MSREVKYFVVLINRRNAMVALHTYPDNRYIIKFVPDNYSDFVNSYQAFGFGVIVNTDGSSIWRKFVLAPSGASLFGKCSPSGASLFLAQVFP